MNPLFEEKYRQVSVSSLEVFGIQVDTRHGKASELAEMINFCTFAAHHGINQYIDSLFYDSNSCCCQINLKEIVLLDDPIANIAFTIAEKTIGQFDWSGSVYHGLPLSEKIDALNDIKPVKSCRI